MRTILPEPPKPSDPRFIDWLYRLWKRVTSTSSGELGLGTMADQDADAVAITGGTADLTGYSSSVKSVPGGFYEAFHFENSASAQSGNQVAMSLSPYSGAANYWYFGVLQNSATASDSTFRITQNGINTIFSLTGTSVSVAGSFEATGNAVLGDATSDTVTVNGYFDGPVSFGTSAWPTTVLAKSSDRVLVGNEGALALWNENNAVGAYCSLYLGAKHNSVATAIAGGLIRAGTESTNYSGFLAFLTHNAAGAYVENFRITSAGDRVVNKATSQYASGSDGYAIISGGSSAALGAAAVLFGESHATAANELHLRNAGNTTRIKLDANGNLLQVSTGAIGYGTGSGGTVTQATSRTTGVTLNKTNGAITLVSAAGSTSWQSFTLTNSTIAATDVVIVNQKSGTDKYIIHVTAVAAGSCQITFATTGGTTTEQPVFNFAVIKGVTS